MSLFTQDTIERVRESASIVEIISAYTDLRRTGDSYSGLCPFHDERTPSFSVSARDNLYYCFGCEAGGDVIKFVQEKEGLGFPEAVEALAERYGIEIQREEEDPQAERERQRRQRLFQLLDRTAGFYVNYLATSPKAKKARDYLACRGLSQEILNEFAVGYAPSDWGVVLGRGQSAGFSIQELREVGLIQKGRESAFYDKFRSRVMFPIRDPRGRTIGFGGRILQQADRTPKYMNSPEGELYHKSRTLYGIDRARGPMAKTGRAVVVEGYTDVLALHQAGITEAIAVMGTAVTPEQLKELFRHAEEVVLALDADRAGREAMLRAYRTAVGNWSGSAKKLTLRVAAMTPGEDPADTLLPDGKPTPADVLEKFSALLDDAVEMPVFHARKILDEANLESPAGRDKALNEVIPVLAGMGETISRDEMAREVADRLNANPALVVRRISEDPGELDGGAAPRRQVGVRPTVNAGGDQAARPQAPARPSTQQRRERALLAMYVAAPERGREFLQKLSAEHLSTPVVERAREWLLDHPDSPLSGLPRDDEELVALVTQVKMMSEREPASEEAMEINFLELEQHMVEQRIEVAQGAGGEALVALQRQRADLAERIARRAAAAR